MSYRLDILINGAWGTLDLNEESPAMNYQLNDLAKLENRNGSYSQNISLPRSRHNLRLLGFGVDVGVVSTVPYAKFTIELYHNGVLLTSNGAALIINALKSRTIDVQIVNSTIDVATDLQGKVMKSTQTDGFWRMFDISNIPQGGKVTLTNGVRMAYGYATLIGGFPIDYTAPPNNFMQDVTKIYPHLNFYDVVKWIFMQEGFTLETDLPDNYINNHYLPCLCISGNEQTVFTPEVSCVKELTTYGNTPIPWSVSGDIRSGVWSQSTLLDQATIYQPLSDETAVIDVNFYGTSMTGGDNQYAVIQITHTPADGGTVTLVNRQIDGSNPTYNIVITQELAPGDTLKILAYGSNALSTPFAVFGDINFNVTQAEQDPNTGPYPTTTIDLLNSLGFDNRADFIKAFMQYYGLLFDVDASRGVVRLYTINRILNSKNDAKDWSEKMVIDRDEEVGYLANGYAQTNSISLTDNESNNIQESAIFPVPDVNLPQNKNLFNVALTTYANSDVVNYPIYTFDEGEIKYNTQKRIGVIAFGSPGRFVPLAQGTVTASRLIPLTINISYGDIAAICYKPIFENILTGFKKVTRYFNLSAYDIEVLDMFNPVWLEKYGSYFYISKIHNYIAPRLTKVDLIKIG